MTGRSVTVPGDGRELAFTYVKSRGLLRLEVAGSRTTLGEVQFLELLERLEIDVSELTPAPGCLLLFGGSDDRRGGLADLMGVFRCETEARAAFAALRLRHQQGADWAELAAVHAAGRVQVLCWFGHDRPAVTLGRSAPGPPAVDGIAAPRRGARRLWRRTTRRHPPPG